MPLVTPRELSKGTTRLLTRSVVQPRNHVALEVELEEEAAELDGQVRQPDRMAAQDERTKPEWKKKLDEQALKTRHAYEHEADESFWIVVVFNGRAQLEDFMEKAKVELDDGLYLDGATLAERCKVKLLPDVPLKPPKPGKPQWAALAVKR